MAQKEDLVDTFPDVWLDLFKLEKPLDWEAFLISDLLERERSHIETFSIIIRVSASISIVSSVLLIAYILRSHQGLSTTYHRLVFGLSISDILTSSGFVLSLLMIPKEMGYLVSGAQGNVGTCATQGFLVFLGGTMSQYYNCSICFYFLSIIKYNKSDTYIRKKLEPWFHGISIVLPLVIGSTIMIMECYNISSEASCFLTPHRPPHCIGYEDGHIVEGFSIPCGRGTTFYGSIIFLILGVFSVAPPPIIIFTTMKMMYRTVLRIERNAQRYGVKTLRLNAQRRHADDDEESPSSGVKSTVRKIILKIQNFSLWTRRNTSKRVSRKRSVLQMATGFTAAWVMVFIPFTYISFFDSYVGSIVGSLLIPLQGLSNFIVFLSPKVRSAKKPMRGQQELSWYKAIVKAYISRGEGRRQCSLKSESHSSNCIFFRRFQLFSVLRRPHYETSTTRMTDAIDQSQA